ncbi:unnamed protein product, partial [Staurois parvus]
MWGNCVLCSVLHCVLCVCFTASTLLCMAVLCTAMQSSVQELTNSSPPCQRCSA